VLLAFLTICLVFGNAGSLSDRETASAQVKEPLSEAARQWVEEVVPYIITPREKDVFLGLPTEADRGQFIETFWKKRDPNPRTPEMSTSSSTTAGSPWPTNFSGWAAFRAGGRTGAGSTSSSARPRRSRETCPPPLPP